MKTTLTRAALLLALLLCAMTAGLTVASHEEVRNLVAPIALYPDPMIAIILPASTYPDQVFAAANMNLGGDDGEINRHDWDISVRELAHYPRMLEKMNNAPDWTIRLGQVYVTQPDQVMSYIQWLRQRARANGVLRSNEQHHVYLNGSYVYIVPYEPTRIYCPEYNPEVVFSASLSNHSGLYLSFGVGMAIGSWLSYDTDWRHQRVTNYGWNGAGAGGWRTRSREHITINNTYNTYYTKNINRSVTINRNVYNRTVNQNRIGRYNIPTHMTAVRAVPARPSAMRPMPPRANTTRPMPSRTTMRSSSNRPITHTSNVRRVQPKATPRHTMTRTTPNRAKTQARPAHQASRPATPRHTASPPAKKPVSHAAANHGAKSSGHPAKDHGQQ